ncbi:MAG: DUF971 domain-containing protein [Verrucomicrobiota bacterium]
MSARIFPKNVAVIGAELAVAWSDGTENFFPLATLRQHCPCAVCQGEADVLGEVERPARQFSEDSFTLRQLQTVGGYALQPVWADGHGTGIYSFLYLRKLAAGPEESAALFGESEAL